MLNAVLEPKKPIKRIAYENVEKLPEHLFGKKTYYDLYLSQLGGTKHLVEMQRVGQESFVERLMVYCFRCIDNQVRSGQKLYYFHPIIALAFLDFNLTPSPSDDYCHVIKPQWRASELPHDSSFEIHCIELKKFKKNILELTTEKDKWLFLIKNLGKLRVIPEIFDNDTFRPVFERARFIHLNKRQQMDYLTTMDHEHDTENQLEYSKKIGRKDGKNEMIEKNVFIGIQQKVDIDIIAKMAGITAERVLEISELLKEKEIDLK